MRPILLSCLSAFIVCNGTLASDRRYPFEQIELDNGLRVITLEDDSCPIVAVQLWYHVGSKNEQPRRQGFAHMFEHMMFRGTDRLGETAHFDYLRRVGGDCNAYTAFDNTTYVQVVPSNQLELVLWLESERMAFLKIDQKGFDTERRVVEEELRMGHNTPYGRVPERLLAEIYGKACYGWTPGGQIADLRASSIDDLAAFWNTYYVPNNATLIIVGAVKHAAAQALAKKYFGWVPRCPEPPTVRVELADENRSGTIKLSEDKGPLPVLGILFRIPPESHADFLPLQIAMGVLGGGESSRLYVDVVRDKKIAQIAAAGAFGFELEGLCGAGGMLLPFGKKKPLIKSLKDQLEVLRETPITEPELQKMKNQLRRAVIEAGQTVEGRARQLGQCAVLEGDVERVNRKLDEIDAVTADAVLKAVKRYLGVDRRINVMVEPSATGMLSSLLSKSDKDAQADLPAASDKENRVAPRMGPKAKAQRPEDFPSTPPTAGGQKDFAPPTTETKRLENGLTVCWVPHHETPLVTMVLGVRSGSWSEQKPGVASAAMGLMAKASRTRDVKTMAEVLESHAIEMSGSSSIDTAQLTASAMVNDIDLAAELLSDVVREPAFPSEEFDLAMKQTKMGLMISSRQPEYLAEQELRRRLYGDHPYSRTETGELADLDKIKVEDLTAWWGEHLRPENCALYVAGDIDSGRALALAEKNFGSWKVDGPFKPPVLPPLPPSAATHIFVVDRPGSVQSQIRVGILGITRKDTAYATTKVLSNIFGGGFNSRLNKAIRVDKGLTYGARGGLSAHRYAGEFKISTFTKTPKTAETLQTLLKEVERMRTSEATPQEIDDTKSYISGAFAREHETAGAIVNEMWMIETEGLPKDWVSGYLKGVKAVGAADIQATARAMLDPSKLDIVVVGEAKAITADLERIAPVTVVNQPSSMPEPKEKPEHVED